MCTIKYFNALLWLLTLSLGVAGTKASDLPSSSLGKKELTLSDLSKDVYQLPFASTSQFVEEVNHVEEKHESNDADGSVSRACIFKGSDWSLPNAKLKLEWQRSQIARFVLFHCWRSDLS